MPTNRLSLPSPPLPSRGTRGSMLFALALAAALAPPAHGVSGTLSGVFPAAPCCDFTWTPPDETGTAPSEITGAAYHSYSFHVTDSGVYTVSSGPIDVPEDPWQGLVALYAPPFDPAQPVENLIGVEHFDGLAEPEAQLTAFLVAGVVYRVVTSNVDEGIHDYLTRIDGPGEVLTSACYPVGDEVDFTDRDTDGFAVQRDRFCVEAEWATDQGTAGIARTVPHRSDDSVLFWFFAPDNWELQVKVLDACVVNGHFWVFFAATTNVEFELRVFGRGSSNFVNPLLWRTYRNPQGHPADAVTDTAAFPCEEVVDQL